ncbi:MAG TPA: Hsp20 family protein [Candidatus Angelobacter sp.]|nr:Hsp20 family protein [Candidatus Angelobacter sp.]
MKEHVAVNSKKDQVVLTPTSLMLWDISDRMTKQIARRAFQLFEECGCGYGHDLDHWLMAEAELLAPIPMKIKETQNDLRIMAQVRGFNEDEVTFNLEKNQLTIRGIKQTEKQGESEIKMIYGSISLPSEVAPEKAHATLKNGTLEIVAPKSATETGKTLAVSAA